MAIYSAKKTISATSYGAADFTIPFEPSTITVVNQDGTLANAVTVSFNGIDDHGEVIPTVVAGLVFRQRVVSVWLKTAAGTPVVRVIAER